MAAAALDVRVGGDGGQKGVNNPLPRRPIAIKAPP